MLFRFLAALQFLTRLPVRLPRAPTDADLVGLMAWYPAVGLLLGAASAGAAWGVHALAPTSIGVSALVALVVSTGLTGAFHLDGVADTMDGLFSGRTGPEAGTIMKDSRIGTMGAVGLFLVLSAKLLATADLVGQQRWWALLLAPAAGRWAAVLVAAGGRSPPWVTSGIGKLLAGKVSVGVLLFSTLSALGPAVVLGWPWGWVVPLLAPVLPCAWLTWRVHHVVGGITGDVLGASVEITEAAFLLGAALVLA